MVELVGLVKVVELVEVVGLVEVVEVVELDQLLDGFTWIWAPVTLLMSLLLPLGRWSRVLS